MLLDPSINRTGGCYVTTLPENGYIESESVPRKMLSLGEYVSEFTRVIFKCNPNHQLASDTLLSFCVKGNWKEDVPNCVPRCSPKVISGVSIEPSRCSFGDEETTVDCSRHTEPGTIARIKCRNHYDRPIGSRYQVVTCGNDGIWSPLPRDCEVVCGQSATIDKRNHIRNMTMIPWHAHVYKASGTSYTYHCGGTIINARVILSAAVCFWDSKQRQPLKTSLFRIVVGKVFRKFDAIEKLQDQKFEIESIIVADIAVVILAESIIFNSYIGPICIPHGVENEDKSMPINWEGHIASWGDNGDDELKDLELLVADRDQCTNESNQFCAGVSNGNVSLCWNDNGSGFAFAEQKRRHRTIYYLLGILSDVSLKGNTCESKRHTVFTNVLLYEDVILTYATRYRPI